VTIELLLDTHVLLWWLSEPERLTQNVYLAIAEPINAVYVSAASIWEKAIKVSIGKLRLPGQLEQDVSLTREKNCFETLSVNVHHAMAVQVLPLIHRDRFDGMLVTQALMENLTLVTSDKRLLGYDVPVLQN
jgi:PIN domain nuclease of toxin-antitoxin system